ncbi:hypothetical protein BPUM_2917 [Bacillus pumilus SAFR-032]|uniref:Uncharacterized protein n=1 Tax=Bacillus pumilus (strain SAFR-032) TaxID=315750 RepID=A8FH55_BACP2|nr:hypothetical protein BPUM_2917 [Bacillus pumilus SAFR-032]
MKLTVLHQFVTFIFKEMDLHNLLRIGMYIESL